MTDADPDRYPDDDLDHGPGGRGWYTWLTQDGVTRVGEEDFLAAVRRGELRGLGYDFDPATGLYSWPQRRD